MALKFIDSLIFYSANLDESVQFYRAIGLPLEDEEHEEGPLHFACELGNAHIAFYQSKNNDADAQIKNAALHAIPKGVAGAVQIGFQVDSVDETLALAISAGAQVLVSPQDAPWGRRAVFITPDGHTVEINQAPIQKAL